MIRWYKKSPEKTEGSAAIDPSVSTELEDFAATQPEAAAAPPSASSTPPAPVRNGASPVAPATGPQASGQTASASLNAAIPANQTKSLSTVLGEVVWLMSQSAVHRQLFISDLEWFAMTPVMLKQFRLFYAKDRAVGAAFWAFVNDEVEERLKSGTGKLRPQDWKSGDKVWIVEVIAPFGGADRMLKDLKDRVFANREIRFVARGPKGEKQLRAV